MNVTVAHPALLEELAAFRKAELLQAAARRRPGTTIHDIRFRVGPVDVPEARPADPPAPPAPERAAAGAGGQPARRPGGEAGRGPWPG